jgi:hypothetical protein
MTDGRTVFLHSSEEILSVHPSRLIQAKEEILSVCRSLGLVIGEIDKNEGVPVPADIAKRQKDHACLVRATTIKNSRMFNNSRMDWSSTNST